jgi:ABC-type nickel/cobalt efflux system permease component RcnA
MNETLSLSAVQRIVESSPVIVLVISFFAWMIWSTWRKERQELMQELKEERAARALAHIEIMSVAERSNEAVHAVREALLQLRQAIDNRSSH